MGEDLRSRGRPRLTYANVVGTLVLFAVIAGGTAMALPGKHRVTADDLHKNAVRAKAIATGAAGSSEIKDGAVGGAEVGDGQISGTDVADQGLAYQDLGANSVVARIRSAGAGSSGDGGQANPAAIPVSGNTWTQAGDEIDTFFGELTYTQPVSCSGTSTYLTVALYIDGKELNRDTYQTDPGQTVTDFFLDARPYQFEPGSATSHTATVRFFDQCTGAGQNFTLHEVKVNTVAIR